jgi:fatty acid desaturase
MSALSLDPARRAELAELHRLNLPANAVALFYFLLWFCGSWTALAFPSWGMRVPAYVVSGIAIHALATLMHEASHGNLFRKRSLDRCAAFVLGAPALLSGAAYRVVHLEHHRHLRTERDPEEFTSLAATHRFLPQVVFYSWMIVGALSYVIHVPIVGFARGSARERREIAVEYALLAGLYTGFAAALAAVAGPHAWHHVLLGPWAVTVLLTNVRGWAEHPMTQAGLPLTQTRTVVTTRLVQFLLCNTNFHLEHHLYPSVPWYRLARLHRLLMPEERAAGAFVESSYFSFLWRAVGTGVWGVLAPPRPPV